jgi:hypothetical protein
MERYNRLESRIRNAAVQAITLRGFWDRLADSLRVPIHSGDRDLILAQFWSLPRGVQEMSLRVLAREHRSVVTIARLWHTQSKLASAEYATAAGAAQAGPMTTLSYDARDLPSLPEGIGPVDVPAVTGNTVRHQLVREPGWLHMATVLGLEAGSPGEGPLPIGVEALFVNGGNIRAGAKQPSNPFLLSVEARRHYPLLDLLGGVGDSFDLGESRLDVAAWLVCRENREALEGSPAADLPAARLSAFDMLDEVTHTRQATGAGVGQMIYTFETLCTGAQVLVRLSQPPWTRRLTRGALACALMTYEEGSRTVGGQSARGFGWCGMERLRTPEDESELARLYEEYLIQNRDALREGLVDGTLCTSGRVVS